MWEFWRTLVPALIAIIPSWFLYQQNKQSGERQERAELARQAHDVNIRELESHDEREREIQEQAAALARADRERILRFAAVARRAILTMQKQMQRSGYLLEVPDDLQLVLSAAAEEVGLLDAPAVRTAALDFADQFSSDVLMNDRSGDSLETILNRFRDAARAYLNGAPSVQDGDKSDSTDRDALSGGSREEAV